jgi:uncharacterized protein YbaR (Trm112 family)
MTDPELLKILCCPETHQAVALADPKLLGELNQGIVSGKVRNRAERLVNETLTEALVRIDGKLIYPVRNGIPVLLIDEGICLPAGPS